MNTDKKCLCCWLTTDRQHLSTVDSEIINFKCTTVVFMGYPVTYSQHGNALQTPVKWWNYTSQYSRSTYTSQYSRSTMHSVHFYHLGMLTETISTSETNGVAISYYNQLTFLPGFLFDTLWCDQGRPEIGLRNPYCNQYIISLCREMYNFGANEGISEF